jgi:tRNA (guanine37-N1)-methyltransferase
MRFDIITIFPEAFKGIFSCGIINRSLKRKLIEIYIHQLRDYSRDEHKKVDDRPYGGGSGMVFKPQPIFDAVEAIIQKTPEKKRAVILLSPQGKRFFQEEVNRLAEYAQLILLCGRYEGVDERIREHLITDELSIGDYVLSGGEIAAMVVVDALTRTIPESLGSEESVKEDSFYTGLLDFPQYTRPPIYRDWKVPEVLLSGNHEAVRLWRKRKLLENTLKKRPDLLSRAKLDGEALKIIQEIQKENIK